jgi:transcriptional/translational regulatory protein YebC/TACO1
VPDPHANPVLRNLIERSKRENVPSHVIDKAIQKAAGAGGENYQAARYEGFGPGGSLVVVDCLTDNNTRTISDVRNCFTKAGCKLSAGGSVVMLFDHVAVISFAGGNEESRRRGLWCPLRILARRWHPRSGTSQRDNAGRESLARGLRVRRASSSG